MEPVCLWVPAGWPDRRRGYRACRCPGRVGLPAWRWRRPQTDAARAMPPDPLAGGAGRPAAPEGAANAAENAAAIVNRQEG